MMAFALEKKTNTTPAGCHVAARRWTVLGVQTKDGNSVDSVVAMEMDRM